MELQGQQDPLEIEDVPDDSWKDLGMVPSPPITIGSMRFLSSATLDLDNIQKTHFLYKVKVFVHTISRGH